MDDNNININDVLQVISKPKIVLFGLSCVERVLCLYKEFEQEIAEEQDPFFEKFKHGYSTLCQLLEHVYYITLTNRFEDLYSNKIEECLAFAPDLDDISSCATIIAQDCAHGLAYVIQYIIDDNILNIIYCKNKVEEIIDMIISICEEDDDQVKVNHRFALEVSTELKALQLIYSLSEPLNEKDINLLRSFDREHLVTV